jgi:trimeric autotransporter adhesin
MLLQLWTRKGWLLCACLSLGLLSLAGCTDGGGSGGPPTPPSLTSLQITPASTSVVAGTSVQLTATGIYSDNTHLDVTAAVGWTSTNTAIATVGMISGQAQGVAAGSVQITASLSGKSATTLLTVTNATLVSVAVTPAAPSIAAGTQQAFKATGMFSDGSTQDVTADMNWSSSNTQVATVAASGLVTSAIPGSTVITATCAQASLCGPVSGSTTLTVTAATLASIEVTPASSSVAKGTSEQLAATGIYTDGSTQNLTSQVSWRSSDTSIATVSNTANSAGLAGAAGVGSVTITATAGNLSSNAAALTVTGATLASIQVTPPTASVAKGVPKQFVATGIYTDNTTQNLTSQVTWSSSNTSVATVSNASGSNGLASSAAVGNSTISAALGNISSNAASLTVTAATLASIQVTPPAPSVASGVSTQFTATGTYTDGSTANITSLVTWNSSDTGAATVSNASGSQGFATSAGLGQTGITAAQGSISSNVATLTVTAATLVSIQVTLTNPSVAAGNTAQFTATGTYTDSSTTNLTSLVTWSSSNTGVATISNASGSKGLASSTTAGASVITAVYGAITSNSTTLTVTAAALVSVQVTSSASSVAAGTAEQFMATGTYTDGSTADITDLVTWSSSDGSVATLSNASGSQGLASTALTGSTLVTAVYGTITSNSAMLTVTAAELVSIQVTPVNPYVVVGNTRQLTATGTYTDSSTQDLTAAASWSSSNTATATIDSSGLATVLASAGIGDTTTISAAVGGITGSTTLGARAVAYAFALYAIDPTLSQYAIGQYAIGLDGSLTALGTTTVNAWAQSLVVDPSGRNLYVAIYSGSIWQYTIEPDGSLTLASSTSSGDLGNPSTMAIDPSGKSLYVVNNNGDANISQYTIGADGALTSMSPATAPDGAHPFGIALDPVAPYAYVANATGTYLMEFARDATSGALSPFPNNTVAEPSSAISIAVDPAGRYVYVVSYSSNTIWQYTIGSDGSLSQPSTLSIQSPSQILIDPSGQYAYVTANNVVAQFTLNPDGSLTAMSTPTISLTGAGYANNMALSPSGGYVYVTSFNSTFDLSTGDYVYQNNIITRCSIGSDGSLTPMDTVATGNDPTVIVTTSSN